MTGFLKVDSGDFKREASVLDLSESAAPGSALGVGKFYASSVDNKPRFVASTGTDYDLTAGGGVRIDNVDVDTGIEVVDSFADTVCTGAYWHYVISKGTNYRSGMINACWNPTTNEIRFREIHTDDIGDTADVLLSVDISGDFVRLRAEVASDDWSVRTKRFFIDD